LRIRLSRKYNEFNLTEAFDPRRTDNTTSTRPSGVARPTSIDSALFLCPFPARIESLVAMVHLYHSAFVPRSFSPLVLDSYIALVHFSHPCLRKHTKRKSQVARDGVFSLHLNALNLLFYLHQFKLNYLANFR